ncbi:hypothetical protein ACP70R_020979 [Stipagrostis hirtigluma subsp. patula]
MMHSAAPPVPAVDALDGEGVTPPPPPSPAVMMRSAAPPVPAVDALDGEGVMPPRPPPRIAATRSPSRSLFLSSAAAGVAGEDLPASPSKKITVASCIAVPPLPFLAAGAVDGGALTPPCLVSMGGTAADGEGLQPTLSTMSGTVSPLHLRQGDQATDVKRAAHPPSAISGEDLLPIDVILCIAMCLRSSRQDVESMRSVCTAWRQAIPSSVEPSLVLSRKNPSADTRIYVFEISRTARVEDAALQIKFPLMPPPAGASCWGSALGLLAMECRRTDDREVFVYCLLCASSKHLLDMPQGVMPKGLFLEPYTPLRFVLMAVAPNGETVLRIDRVDFPWVLDGRPSWLPSPGFDDLPLKSVALSTGILRAVVGHDSIIIIDEAGRPWDALDEMVALQTPLSEEDQHARPWNQNGHHLFICEGKLYYTEILDSTLAPDGIAVRLFCVEKLESGRYSLVQARDIGPFALYVGANQAFVVPASDHLIGRLANTMYLEDYRGKTRWPRIVAINIESLSTFTIPFPKDIATTVHDLLPATWVGLPPQKDVLNHCNTDEHWGWW